MSAFDTNNYRYLVESLGLPLINSFDDLVAELRLSHKLVYWLSQEDVAGKYNTFYIDKKSGKKRRIDEPIYSLKIVQRWLLYKILYKIKPSKYSYGFVKTIEKSKPPLVQVAEKHQHNLYLMKMDLKDFYPSIHRKRVYSLFRKIGYNSSVSNLLTNICVFEDHLPQGAVTSAYLANLVCKRLDNRIAGYCNKRSIIYTRYADDMAFSSDDRELLRKDYNIIKAIIENEGFSLNTEKTRFSGPITHKEVLGITINNSDIKAPKRMKRNVRQFIHRQIATGDYQNINVIRGYISYINSIEPGYTKKIKKYVRHLIESELSTFPELVDAYNRNKLFSDFPDMGLKNVSDFCTFENESDARDRINEIHEEYLMRNRIIKV